jgi:hypothetical protein
MIIELVGETTHGSVRPRQTLSDVVSSSGDISRTRGCGRFRFLIMDSELKTTGTQCSVLSTYFLVMPLYLHKLFVDFESGGGKTPIKFLFETP